MGPEEEEEGCLDIGRELELFRQQWFSEIHDHLSDNNANDSGKSRNGSSNEPTVEDEVIQHFIILVI